MPPPRLVYLVTEDWAFVSHRLPMARAAQRAGYDVHVATRVRAHADVIRTEGFQLHPIEWRRGSTNPFNFIRNVIAVRRLYRSLMPDLAHQVSLQASIVGSLAALGMPIITLNALAGLGFVFTSSTWKARLARPVMSLLLRFLLGRSSAAVLVQNPDDRRVLEGLGIRSHRVSLIPGSGVDINVLVPLAEPRGPITMAFVGRLLDDKGLRTLIAAYDLLGRRGASVRLLIAGEADAANPSSIPEQEIESWASRPSVRLLGYVEDIRAVWAEAHIAVLPSRREGLPMSLLEAAACGRPMVATDVPGCREIARADVNALLVPVDDATALADAINRLARDRELRQRFGAASRRLVEQHFSSARVGTEIVALYDRLIGKTGYGTQRD